MLKQSGIYANIVNGGFKMTVNELIEFLTDSVKEKPELGEFDVLMIGEESGDTCNFAGYVEGKEAIHLRSVEYEDADYD